MAVYIKNFQLRVPTDGLMIWGVALIFSALASVSLQKPGIYLGASLIARVVVLIWMPGMAKRIHRSPVFWTITAFIVPSISFMVLSFLGYKPSEQVNLVHKKCSEDFFKKQQELAKQLERGEIDYPGFDAEVKSYEIELQNYARKELVQQVDIYDTELVNTRLEEKGYVLNDKSEVFVEYSDKCPACGTEIKKGVENCPECKLKFA